MARRKFSPEFKAEAVALVLERGLSSSQVARDLGVGQPTISRWVKASEEAAAPGALSSAEREELKRRVCSQPAQPEGCQTPRVTHQRCTNASAHAQPASLGMAARQESTAKR